MQEISTQIQKGIYHILDTQAYDHIIFLVVLAVPFLFDKWKRVLILITVLTLGHIISLLLVTYDIVSINRNLIEFLIPLVILIVALYNILTSGKRPQSERFGIVFLATAIFGLLHGFTFESLLERIFSANTSNLFNILYNGLGIWIGQLIIAFICLFLGFICQTIFRFNKRDWVLVISAIVVGLLLPLILDKWNF